MCGNGQLLFSSARFFSARFFSARFSSTRLSSTAVSTNHVIYVMMTKTQPYSTTCIWFCWWTKHVQQVLLTGRLPAAGVCICSCGAGGLWRGQGGLAGSAGRAGRDPTAVATATDKLDGGNAFRPLMLSTVTTQNGHA